MDVAEKDPPKVCFFFSFLSHSYSYTLYSLTKLDTDNVCLGKDAPAVSGGKGPGGTLSRRQRKILRRARAEAGLTAQDDTPAASEQQQQHQQTQNPPADSSPVLTLTMAPTVVMSVAPSQPPQQQVREDTIMAETPAVLQIQAKEEPEEEQQVVDAVEIEEDEDQIAFEADLDNT